MLTQPATANFASVTSIAGMLSRIETLSKAGPAAERHWADKLATLVRDADEEMPLTSGSRLAPWQIRRVRQFVVAHVEGPIRLEAAAKLISLSRSHFSRCFRNSFGEAFGAFVLRQRVAHAQALMLTTREPLSQIAIASGFADQAHFTRSFSRQMGWTPSAWRRSAVAAA
jgi:AraC family transcriptional regulator